MGFFNIIHKNMVHAIQAGAPDPSEHPRQSLRLINSTKSTISGYLWLVTPDKNSDLVVWMTLFAIAALGPAAHARLKRTEIDQSPSTSGSYGLTIFLSLIANFITKLLLG